MNIKFSNKWQCHVDGDIVVTYRGSINIILDVVAILKTSDFSTQGIQTILNNNNVPTSAIIQISGSIIVWVDHIRAWPIFYRKTPRDICFTDDIFSLSLDISNNNINRDALIEFSASGYVSGPSTILNDFQVLEPGDLAIYNKESNEISIQKHFKYQPINKKDKLFDFDNQCKVFECILNEIFDEIICHAEKEGSRIWVPLSAGLDSRLVLTKLVERGCENIACYTYGPIGNYEVPKAKRIAKELRVDWHRINLSRQEIKNIYHDETTKCYIRSAFQYKAVPAFGGYFALHKLKRQGLIKSNDIVINGQTGDFISGGHLSNYGVSEDTTWSDNQKYITNYITKHYSLIAGLGDELTKSNFYSRFIASFSSGNDNIVMELDQHEYYNRQCLYVINAQRIYEHFGLNWVLPLWDKRIVNFFESVPFDYRFNQKFYKLFLLKMNYLNQFSKKEKPLLRFPKPFIWIIAIAKLIQLLFGNAQKQRFYERMKYFGHYSDQYSVYDYKTHSKLSHLSKNIVAHRVVEILHDYLPVRSIKVHRISSIVKLYGSEKI